MFLSAILSILGLGVLAYVMVTLAVYALPFFVAVAVGMYLHDAEAGVLVALVVAFVAGAATLLAGQIAFATIRSVPPGSSSARSMRSPRGLPASTWLRPSASSAAQGQAGHPSSPPSARSSSAARRGHGWQGSPVRTS